MTLIHAAISWEKSARIHLVSVDDFGAPVPPYTAFCGQSIPGQVWINGGRIDCQRCHAKASKDGRFHAEAKCPDCGKLKTRPLAHLIFTHKWARDAARQWVAANADIVGRGIHR